MRKRQWAFFLSIYFCLLLTRLPYIIIIIYLFPQGSRIVNNIIIRYVQLYSRGTVRTVLK